MLGATKFHGHPHGIPEWLRRYVAALCAFLLTLGIAKLLLVGFGPKSVLIISLLGDLLVLGAAWLGYGPGVVVCTLTVFVAPRILTPDKASHPDLGRFGLLVLLCMVISFVAASKRRTEKALRRAAEELESRVEQRTRDLQMSEQRLREQAQLLDIAPAAILAADAQAIIQFWSLGAERLYGWSAEEALGKVSHELLHTSLPRPFPQFLARLEKNGFWESELTHIRKDGSQVTVMSRWGPRTLPDGTLAGFLEVNTDLTDHRRIEEQLRQSQKMESVGLLAGGVAHDFNNLLTVINGYSEMVLADLPKESPIHESIAEIRAAGERAAALTRQLLAFGRKQLVHPKTLNVNQVVADIQKMLGRLIGEHIEMVMRLEPDLAYFKGDEGQLQQVIVNLAVNARDAMPRGGTLTLETANAEIDEDMRAAHPEAHGNRAILLAVTDTGTGMTREVKARLFEPFFTTKPKGSGTGLGLATVYGMVRQAGGWIAVESEPGEGSTFRIYLPAMGAGLAESKAAPARS